MERNRIHKPKILINPDPHIRIYIRLSVIFLLTEIVKGWLYESIQPGLEFQPG